MIFLSLFRSHFLDSPRCERADADWWVSGESAGGRDSEQKRAEEMSAELQKKLEAQAAPSELEKEMEALRSRLEAELQERREAEEKHSSLEMEMEKPSEALLRSQHMCEQVLYNQHLGFI